MKAIMVVYYDETDAPRAWAIGPEERIDEIESEAWRHLTNYCAKHNIMDNPFTIKKFKFEGEEIDEIQQS